MKEREAVPQVRYGRFELRRPAILKKIKTLKVPAEVSVIYAAEETSGADGEPVTRFLITNQPADTVYEKVCRYTQRWKIERFHYVLKSGCAAEKLQERRMDKTTVLVLRYSFIAAAVMNLTYIVRFKPELPCTVYFEEEEWRLLYRTANKTNKTPVNLYTIGEAVSCLGRLGGSKRAPGGGPPGVKRFVRAYCAQYLACLPPLAAVMLWVKFYLKGGAWMFRVTISSISPLNLFPAYLLL